MRSLALVLSDIHGEADVLASILREHRNAQLILAAGDMTNFGRKKEAETILKVFESELPPEIPLFFVAGNCDTQQAREVFSRHPGYIDGSSSSCANPLALKIAGCGGGLLHTGLTPYERRDEELESSLVSVFSRLSGKPAIVLTHTPPYGTFADLKHGKHLGSLAFQNLLYSHNPPVWICGHIHEGRSVSHEGETLVINPGPAAHGSYALLVIESQGSMLNAAAELRSV